MAPPTSPFVLIVNEYIHGPDFGELPVRAVQPEHLVASLLGGLLQGVEGGSVVRAHLGIAAASWPGPYAVRIGVQRYGHLVAREIVAHWTQDCEEEGRFGFGNSQGSL